MNTDAAAICLALPPFFEDHHVGGRPVLPAVEAMELLAAGSRRRAPEHAAWVLSDIRFDKFLFLDSRQPPQVVVHAAPLDSGARSGKLTSRFTAPGAAISRTLTHAALTIGHALPPAVHPPLEKTACLCGTVTAVDPDRIYREMVPFGPAYRNIRRLLVSPDGALARIGSPDPPDPRTDLCLGSPYILDAAFHAACVWCQRFGNTVAFPVAAKHRVVVRPTRPDERYTARIIPIRTDQSPFVFDIVILDDGGRLREAALGVEMRDVSGGRTTPPHGFWLPAADDPLSALRRRVSGLILVEREAVAEFASAALSDNEKRRLMPMTPARAAGYLSARLALKRLSRARSGSTDRRHAREIETMASDGRIPRCPLADGSDAHCSVAHDHRFTVAVTADRPVGVDVEPLSGKALRAPDFFMNAAEMGVAGRAPLEPAEAALRIWSAKEAAAKALGRDLAETWRHVSAIGLTAGESRLMMNGEQVLTAWHARVEGHLFTLLAMDGQR